MKILPVVALAVALSAAVPTEAASTGTSCTLEFSSEQWSALYEHSEGAGTITCDDGSRMEVDIAAKGIGLSLGRWKIDHATGKFTRVKGIRDLLGNYAALGVNAGLVKSGTAQALTNGTVSLVLAGSGEGFDVGLTISKFRIERSAIDGST